MVMLVYQKVYFRMARCRVVPRITEPFLRLRVFLDATLMNNSIGKPQETRYVLVCVCVGGIPEFDNG